MLSHNKFYRSLAIYQLFENIVTHALSISQTRRCWTLSSDLLLTYTWNSILTLALRTPGRPSTITMQRLIFTAVYFICDF